MSTVQNIFSSQCNLGEGPMWHPTENGLYWVDILQKELHFYDPNREMKQKMTLNKMPGAVVPTNQNKYLLVSMEDGIIKLNNHTMEQEYLVRFHKNESNMRANDGKCDPFGNFWVGTMSKTCEEGAGALYCYRPDGTFLKQIENVTISNGLCWSPTGYTMYYIDTFAFCVKAYDCDSFGNLSNERIVLDDTKKELAYLDGMTIDTEGMLWIAHCTGGYIARWNPETGQILEKYELPVPKCTSLTFGGLNYNTLYITTAQEHMSQNEIKQYPQSGDIFELKTNFKGFKTHTFNFI